MKRKTQVSAAELFLAYLAFAGDSTKVSLATGIPAEIVDTAAAKDDWPRLLKVYVSSCRIDDTTNGRAASRRVVVEILTRQLQEIVGRVVQRLNATDTDTLLNWFSPRTSKRRERVPDLRVLVDLSRALFLLSRIADSHENTEDMFPNLGAAIQAVLAGADGLPGLDAAMLGRDGLAVWRNADQAREGDK